jgi:hypothetical protein
MDDYNYYNKIKMAKKQKNKENTTFIKNGVHMHITLCHLDYVIFLPHFKKW